MPLDPNEFLFEYNENGISQGFMGELEYKKHWPVYKYLARATWDGLIAIGRRKETAIARLIKKWGRQQRKEKDSWNPGKKKIL